MDEFVNTEDLIFALVYHYVNMVKIFVKLPNKKFNKSQVLI
jgi:hypothetical protein